VTVVSRTSEAARIAGRPGEYLQESVAERFPDLAERLTSAEREPLVRTVGCFALYTKRASAPGAMLVGDAAAFVDPFTGEGIYFGLSGARIAADVANACLRSGDLSGAAMAAYDVRRKEMRQRYFLCGIVQAVVRTPHLMERVVRRCGREPMTLSHLMQVLGDIAPPGDVLRPAFAARLFR
jgi:2-polyprenyl-6-methoxyphenol hydroxylase-like FAD-dependent oxidoreductase